jgi:hypothetical protein
LNPHRRTRNEPSFDLVEPDRKGFPMSVNKVIAAATLPAMIASPVAAAAHNPAASLSLRGDAGEAAMSADAQANPNAQIPVPTAEAATAGGVSTALLVGGAVVALVVIGAVAMGRGHHGSSPASA